MAKRKVPPAVNEVYHIFSKSIAGFKIFNNKSEFSRMLAAIRYYQIEKPARKFCKFIKLNKGKNDYFGADINVLAGEKLVEIVCYCIMPTHLHLILKQLKEKGISTFMFNILCSYSHYFNIKHNRKGPLWEARFKNVLVETDEQLLHLTRYIHLNPATAHLVDKPEDWPSSSYREYIGKANNKERVCNYKDLLEIEPNSYKKFVEDRVSYQRELATIKGLVLE